MRRARQLATRRAARDAALLLAMLGAFWRELRDQLRGEKISFTSSKADAGPTRLSAAAYERARFRAAHSMANGRRSIAYLLLNAAIELRLRRQVAQDSSQTS